MSATLMPNEDWIRAITALIGERDFVAVLSVNDIGPVFWQRSQSIGSLEELGTMHGQIAAGLNSLAIAAMQRAKALGASDEDVAKYLKAVNETSCVGVTIFKFVPRTGSN